LVVTCEPVGDKAVPLLKKVIPVEVLKVAAALLPV
jgi:hypothetical protein